MIATDFVGLFLHAMLRQLTNALMLFAILGLVTPALAGHVSAQDGRMPEKLHQVDHALHMQAQPVDHLSLHAVSPPSLSQASNHGHHKAGANNDRSCCQADCNCATAHCQALVVQSLLFISFEQHSAAVDTSASGAVVHTQDTLFRPPAIV